MRVTTHFVSCTVGGFIAAEDSSVDAFVDDGGYFAELFGAFPETCPGHLREALGVDARGGGALLRYRVWG